MPKLNGSLHPNERKKSPEDVPTPQTLPSENFFISAYHFFKQTISEFNPTPIPSAEPNGTKLRT